MDNNNLILLLGGGALLFWLYNDRNKNGPAPTKLKRIKVEKGFKTAPNGTTTPIANVGGNPKTEEQPIISTDNAQQPPTIVETFAKNIFDQGNVIPVNRF
jgi:hypothetical protein